MALVFLALCLFLALAFEFSNGFHDTANAVATVIYTNSLKTDLRCRWSGVMNFLGVIFGRHRGCLRARRTHPARCPFAAEWRNRDRNVGGLVHLRACLERWHLVVGIPNSSSHALIGSLIGIAVENSVRAGRGLHNGSIGIRSGPCSALLISPILGFVLAFLLFRLTKLFIHDRHLYKPPEKDRSPIWWMRCLLVLTCTAYPSPMGRMTGKRASG